jgi:hypothetical protein
VLIQEQVGACHHVTPIGSSVRPPDIPVLAKVNGAAYLRTGRQRTGYQSAGAKARIVDRHGLQRRTMIDNV